MNKTSTGLNIMSLSADHRKTSRLLDRWQQLLQKHFHDNVEAQTVRVFLTIISKEEPTDLTEINRYIGLYKSALSRNFYILEKGKGGEGGLELVHSVIDYNDRRRLLVELTPKGVAVATELMTYIPSRIGVSHVSQE